VVQRHYFFRCLYGSRLLRPYCVRLSDRYVSILRPHSPLSFYRTTHGDAAVSSVTGTISEYGDYLIQLQPVFDLLSVSRDNGFVDFFDQVGDGLKDFGEVIGCDFGADKYTTIRLPVIVFD
jgi:hypothetical protein